ncbi:MAG: helix-turn-helix transcriptional regulator [Kofleriaceae bacterium]|nr:helix-turn-helix transcriptional regulator [Kofleriaceae bacterium]
MLRFPEAAQGSAPTLGFHVAANLSAGEQVFDALIIDDGDTLTTLLLPKATFVSKMRALFEGHGLSPAELAVINLVLQGHANREIAQRLFVSRQTLKTHLNNINKKVPISLGVEALRRRLRLEA